MVTLRRQLGEIKTLLFVIINKNNQKTMDKIRDYLLSQQDIKYRNFALPLVPNIDEKTLKVK